MIFWVQRPKVRAPSVSRPILKILHKFEEISDFRNLGVAEYMGPIWRLQH